MRLHPLVPLASDNTTGRRVRCASVVVCSVVMLLITPLAAHAAPRETIDFDDGTSCIVNMQNVHASRSLPGDASAAIDVNCRPPGGGPKDKQLLDAFSAETTIGFSEYPLIPGLISSEPIGTCPRFTKLRERGGEITCHQPGRGSGHYTGESNVTITYRGVTKEIDVSQINFFTPTA